MSVYWLHPIRSTKDPLFFHAIGIYVECTHWQLITNTNEISYWLNEYNKTFAPDTFNIVALIKDRRVIGYCQFATFAKDKLVAMDYICIAKQERRGLTPYLTFVRLMNEYLAERFAGYDLIVEAMAVSGGSFEAMLKRSGFAVIHDAYHQPALGDMKGDLRGKLLIHPARSISEQELLSITQCLAVNHYERWYSIYDRAHIRWRGRITLPM